MTLSERLERAKRERMLAAGLLHSEAALKPEAEIDVTDPAGGGVVSYGIEIEATASGLHSVGPASAPTTVTATATTATLAGERTPDCPNCRRPGNVDMVDLIGHAVHMSCPRCSTLWRVPRPSAQEPATDPSSRSSSDTTSTPARRSASAVTPSRSIRTPENDPS